MHMYMYMYFHSSMRLTCFLCGMSAPDTAPNKHEDVIWLFISLRQNYIDIKGNVRYFLYKRNIDW